MNWFNPCGLLFMTVIMIPNIVFAVKCKDGFQNRRQNRFVEILEQIGRYGCFAFMIINIPCTVLGFPSRQVFLAYLIVDAVLLLAYCVIWIVRFRQDDMFRAVTLSVIPSVIFLFSGMSIRSLPLIAAALLFAPCHILISCKNAARL